MNSLPRDIVKIIAEMVSEVSLAAVSRVFFEVCPFKVKRKNTRALLSGRYKLHEFKGSHQILFIDENRPSEIWTYEATFIKTLIYKNNKLVSSYDRILNFVHGYKNVFCDYQVSECAFAIDNGQLVNLKIAELTNPEMARGFCVSRDEKPVCSLLLRQRKDGVEYLLRRREKFVSGFYKGKLILQKDELNFNYDGITYPGFVTDQRGHVVLSRIVTYSSDESVLEKQYFSNLNTGKTIRISGFSHFLNGSVVEAGDKMKIINDDMSAIVVDISGHSIYEYKHLFVNIRHRKITFVTKRGRTHTVDFDPTIIGKLTEIDEFFAKVNIKNGEFFPASGCIAIGISACEFIVIFE